MSARTRRGMVVLASVALLAGAWLSRTIEPGVRVEKVILSGHTPALRLSPATPGPHPHALLAHGATGSKEMFFCCGEALAAAGFDCYSIDQAGHGESPRRCTFANLLVNPQDLLRGIGTVDVFVGHSMGGGVGAWSVNEAGFRPQLFIAIGSNSEVGANGPPVLKLIGRYDVFRSITQRATWEVISPWSDHIFEPYDPVLVNAAVERACAVVGHPVPAAPTAWRWRLAGLVLGLAGTWGLMIALPDLHPRLARIRWLIVPAVLLCAGSLTLRMWVGVTPQLRRVPALLALLVVLSLALAGLNRLRWHRWSLVAMSGILAVGFIAVFLVSGRFRFAMLMATFVVGTFLLGVGAVVGSIAARGGTRRDGDIALTLFASYAIAQFMPLVH